MFAQRPLAGAWAQQHTHAIVPQCLNAAFRCCPCSACNVAWHMTGTPCCWLVWLLPIACRAETLATYRPSQAAVVVLGTYSRLHACIGRSTGQRIGDAHMQCLMPLPHHCISAACHYAALHDRPAWISQIVASGTSHPSLPVAMTICMAWGNITPLSFCPSQWVLILTDGALQQQLSCTSGSRHLPAMTHILRTARSPESPSHKVTKIAA